MVPASHVLHAPRPLREPWHPHVALGAHAPELAALLLAAAFHAAALGCGWLVPAPPEDGGLWVPVVAEIEVDLAAEPDAAGPVLSSPEPRIHRVEGPVISTPAATPRSPLRASRATARGPHAQEPLPAATPSSAPREYDGPAPPVPMGAGSTSILRGLPGMAGPLWVPPAGGAAPPAPTTSPKPAPDREVATRLLAESMNERDMSLGLTLPAAGNVASALASAVRTALGPAAGSGTFVAILTPSGKVLGIQAIASKGGTADAWASAARAAAASLSGRSFGMEAPFENGAVVWVDVVSSLVLPSGASAAVTPASGGFSFDVADIGARKRQVVRTTFRVAAVK